MVSLQQAKHITQLISRERRWGFTEASKYLAVAGSLLPSGTLRFSLSRLLSFVSHHHKTNWSENFFKSKEFREQGVFFIGLQSFAVRFHILPTYKHRQRPGGMRKNKKGETESSFVTFLS